jgi:hypothetical protein
VRNYPVFGVVKISGLPDQGTQIAKDTKYHRPDDEAATLLVLPNQYKLTTRYATFVHERAISFFDWSCNSGPNKTSKLRDFKCAVLFRGIRAIRRVTRPDSSQVRNIDIIDGTMRNLQKLRTRSGRNDTPLY